MTPTIHRRWWKDTTPLRQRLTFDYHGEKRATGYLEPEDWGDVLAGLDELLDIRFEIVLFQAYRDGTATTGWHDDDYPDQAMLSIGATRTFGLRPPAHAIRVADGDLVYLTGRQEHAVLPDPDVVDERCSIVFRTYH